MLSIPDYAMQMLVVWTMANTILAMELLKRKHYYGWYVSICNQALWVTINVDKALWGFLVLNTYITFNAIHAIILWKKHDAADLAMKTKYEQRNN